MSDVSSILGLPLLMPSQAQKHVTHNEALRQLDAIVQLTVEEFNGAIPPTVPQEGAVYALGADPTGVWAGHAFEIAIWQSTYWHFIPPLTGWRAWGLVESELRLWDGADWTRVPADTQNLDGVGIGTVSDATNRLAVQSPATLLSHEGAGHQVKVNKAASGDTASLLYQTNWSGRAEMGLAGDDAFSIKVSPDGGTWKTALAFDPDTGLATGEAVQSTLVDPTAGRLMPVGAFGLGEVAVAPVLGDLDDPLTATGFYQVNTNTTTGTYPAGAYKGMLMLHRYSGGWCVQEFTYRENANAGALSGGYKYIRAYNATSGLWSDWALVFNQATLLGAVSQSGGAPTGAVIERGSNANGEYVRFADGTQICTRRMAILSSSTTWTFPAAFAAVESMVAGSEQDAVFTTTNSLTANSVLVKGFDTTGAQVAVSMSSLMAIGRWF